MNVLDTEIYLYALGSGPPLLFIHGHRADALRFRKILDFLAQFYTVYAPDLPGFGKSAPLKKRHSVQAYSFYLSALLEKLKLKDLTVVGLSLGGTIAVFLALEQSASSRIKNLVLIGTPVDASLLKPTGMKFHLLRLLIDIGSQFDSVSFLTDKITGSDKLMNFFLRRGTLDLAFQKAVISDRETLEYEKHQWRIMPMKVWFQTAADFFRLKPPTTLPMSLPTLIIATPHDHLIDMGKTVEVLQKIFPVNEVVWLPLDRHVPVGELPTDFIERLSHYFEKFLPKRSP